MPVNFPNSPSNGDTTTISGVLYTYDSSNNSWKPSVNSTDFSTVTNTPTTIAGYGITDAFDGQYSSLTGVPSAGASITTYADMAALIAATGMSNGDQAFVTGNNNLYLYSGSGWYKIATVQNDSPSAITGVSGTYELAIDGTATTITAVSTDPEGFPLTWSYSTSGLGSIATISQSDNVFTITPSTTEADAGTFNLTINATDGVNGAVSTSTNLTLEFIVIVTNSKYTTLLATATGTSDNNNITDTSTNNHTITVNGDAYAGTFSPYRHGGYSAYWGGTMNIASTMTAIGTSNFTIEAWINFSSISGSPWILDGRYDASSNGYGNGGLGVRLNSSGQLWANTSQTTTVTGTTVLSTNTWHHIMVVRSGTGTNEFKVYLNGNLEVQGTDANSKTATWFKVGSSYMSGNNPSGYIRDLRISTTARDTTIPTEPVEADSDTIWLGCSLPYFADASSSNNSLTITGDLETRPFGPYDNLEYAAADNGGSIHHSGAGGNYLSLPTAPTIGTSDFEISMWLYPETKAGDDVIIDFRPTSTNGSYINFLLTGGVPNLNVNGAAINGSLTDELRTKVWSYLTLTRVSGSTKLYVNGTQTGNTYSDSNNYLTGSNRPVIAQAGYTTSSTLGFNGYMSDLIIKLSGNSSPSVPTAPVSSSGTALHIQGTDASVIDKSQVNNIKMNGPTTGSTTKTFVVSEPTISFASGSNTDRYLNFDPTVLDFMEILGNPSIPFTIEGIWGWQGSTASPIFEIFQDTNNFFYFGGGTGNTQSGIATDYNVHAIFKIGGVERFKLNGQTGSYNNVGSSFKHQAITRNSSGLMQHYYDGQLSSNTITHSGSDTVSWTSPVGYVGRSDWMGIYGRYEGYIHQVRLTVGLARYTANFTPPTASLKG